jgi:hypothetical protein
MAAFQTYYLTGIARINPKIFKGSERSRFISGQCQPTLHSENFPKSPPNAPQAAMRKTKTLLIAQGF